MEKFICCDWGTSALRLRVIDINEMSVLSETGNAQGISATFNLWKQSGVKEDKRDSFYKSILAAQINKLEKQSELSLENVPLIISGMASSSIGMMELPYKEIPFGIDGAELNIKIFEATEHFKHSILLISGAKTADDAMRGEETQLVGCMENQDKPDHFFVFPGTHSKHVVVSNGKVTDIKTYMTGEIFELLSKKSILADSMENTPEKFDENDLKFFKRGVKASLHSNILHDAFRVRVNQLFDRITKQENYWYLSGVLIGTELKDLANSQIPVTIVGDELQIKLYGSAFNKFGNTNIKFKDSDKVIIKGHFKIYNLYKPLLIS